jgi:hypothetical protein
VSDEELIVAFALTRLDHPGLDLDEVAALLVRRLGPESTVDFAAQNLADRGELRGTLFDTAVERVMRVVLALRDAAD